MKDNIKLITYKQYDNLPEWLKYNLNILRTNTYEDVVGNDNLTIDENDIEFLNLTGLNQWIKEHLPSYDMDFLKAAERVHKECYEKGLFDYFAVCEEDLFVELLHVKDWYEMTYN